MSKIVKRKITVQLQNTRETSQNRPSVFQRLGNKKTNHPASEQPASIKVTAILAQPSKATTSSSSASAHAKMKHHSSKAGSSHHHRLDDADPDSLEQKRAELKKELEIQLKMESAARKTKAGATAAGSSRAVPDASRKRKTVTRRSSSSSSSSSSGSDSSSDSSSSDSTKGRRSGNKVRQNVKTKRHQSSSSSESEEPRRKAKPGGTSSSAAAGKAKRVCHKKLEAAGKIKTHHAKKTLEKPHSVVQQRKRSPSPSQIVIRKHQRPSSPGAKPSTKAASKAYVDPVAPKHHRLKEPMASMSNTSSSHRDKEREFQIREREREHLRARERVRSRSPAKQVRMKSRSPGTGKRVSRTRDVKQRTPPPGSLRRPSSKSRSGTMVGVRRGDRTPERIIIKKDVSGKRHEGSRERDHRRDRDREREAAAAARAKERQELIRAQERARERDRLEHDRVRVKVIDSREREVDRSKSDRLLPRPAERAMALAAARDRSRDKSEDRGGVHDGHHRPRSLSHSRSGRGEPARGVDRLDVYGDARYDRLDDRYEMHRRLDKERSSAGLIRDDRSDRGDREREYLMVRRREDSRGRIIEESLVHDPYLAREKIRGPISERDRSMERERDQRGVYGSERDRERMHGEHGRYEEHIPRGSLDDRRLDRGAGSDRGHDYGRPSSRGGYIDESRGPSHRVLLDRERGVSDRDGWHRGGDMDAAGIRGDDRGSGHHMYDRHSGRDWDRNELPGIRQPSASRAESNYPMEGGRRDLPEWSSGGDRQWDDRMERGHGADRVSVAERGHHGERGSWQHSERDVEKWDGPEEYGTSEYHRGQIPDKIHHEVESGSHSVGQGGRGGQGSRRWPGWRGGRGGGGGSTRVGGAGSAHGEGSTNLFRRQNAMHTTDTFQDHQPDHHFRRNQVGHHHNAFSTSNVRPLLSLPPLKPPIMDDDVPSLSSPSMVQGRKPPLLSSVLPLATNAPVDAPKEEVPTAPVVSITNNPAADPEEQQQVPLGTPDENAEPSVSVPKEATTDDCDPEDGEGDALSEISDDADEILNRQEEEAAAAALKAAAAHPPVSLKPALLPTPAFKVGEYPRMLIHPTYNPNALMGQSYEEPHIHHMHQPHPHHVPSKPLIVPSSAPSDALNDSKDDDLDLDFEEISDGELEEEARIRCLGDALGVDWASLVNEAKSKLTMEQYDKLPSAKLRWQPHRILLDVGVSFRMAGKEFASNVLNAAHRQLKADEAEARRLEAEKLQQLEQQKAEEQGVVKIKKEILDEDEMEQPVEPVEPVVPVAEPEDAAELLIHPIACVQVASRVNAETRKNLVFGMTGPYSRALCAHRDIQMRRQLSGLPVKRCAPVVGGSGGADYAVIARQLFEKALGKVV